MDNEPVSEDGILVTYMPTHTHIYIYRQTHPQAMTFHSHYRGLHHVYSAVITCKWDSALSLVGASSTVLHGKSIIDKARLILHNVPNSHSFPFQAVLYVIGAAVYQWGGW